MRTITSCRSCNSERLVEFLDLGEQYVSDFREDDSKPSRYPLVAVICDDCKLVQLRDTTPSGEMYHENYGFKSGISNSIKDDLKEAVAQIQTYHSDPKSWLDIASNDGTLLSFVPKDMYRVGIDPITKYCKEAEQFANKIINDFFVDGSLEGEKFDIITAVSCFYDMDDPNDFVAGVEKVLADKGVWLIQQNYLLPTLQLNAVDNFCHEHLEYYTLLSLEPLLTRHGLEVIDLSTSTVNGGSLRTVVAKKGMYPIQDRVEKQRTVETDYGLHTMAPYGRFARDVYDNLNNLKELVNELKASGKTVCILAASTRGSTIWQSAGIGEQDVLYAVERNPEKVGKYFSAIGIPIVSEEQFRKDKPDYAIIGPWFFAYPEIINRERDYVLQGGSLIVPLPELNIIHKDNLHAYTVG